MGQCVVNRVEIELGNGGISDDCHFAIQTRLHEKFAGSSQNPLADIDRVRAITQSYAQGLHEVISPRSGASQSSPQSRRRSNRSYQRKREPGHSFSPAASKAPQAAPYDPRLEAMAGLRRFPNA